MILLVKKAKLSKKGSDIVVTTSKGQKTYSSLDLDLLVIIGNEVEIDSGTLIFLSSLNATVLIHGKKSDVVLVPPFLSTISSVRRAQYTMSDSFSLLLAKKFIEGKIRGMINLMKHFAYLNKLNVSTIPDLTKINSALNIDELRVVEAELSKEGWEELRKFFPKDFPGRKPRNDDVANRAIDYVYSLLYSLCTHALISSGLDPFYGVMHSNQPGKYSLTYDFSEMFKPFGVHVVLTTIRKGVSLSLDKRGYLNSSSLVSLTKNFYDMMIKRKIRALIYAKANELKKAIVEYKSFVPYVYKPKD